MVNCRLKMLCIVVCLWFLQAKKVEVTAVTPSNFSQVNLNSLFSLYNSTGGDNWCWETDTQVFGIHWDFHNSSNPCSDRWQRLTCGVQGSMGVVISLQLGKFGLNGTLPSSIANLSSLIDFNATDNRLHGTIPFEFGQMANLTTIVLAHNKFHGPIPAELGNCSALTLLDFKNNRFIDGSIPVELSKLKQLQTMDLQVNRINGTIPVELGDLTQLTSLLLNQNFLSGVIPSTLSQLTQLETLRLNGNDLTGTIPETFSALTQLRVFSVFANKLIGTLPSAFGAWVNLIYFSASHNLFHGTLPSSYGNWTRINTFDIGFNYNITGTLPVSYGAWGLIQSAFFESNQLFGTIPDQFITGLHSIKYLDFGFNIFSGTLPSSLFNLTTILDFSVASNRISGTIPALFGNLITLRNLELATNIFVGSIPPELGNLPHLLSLALAANELTNTIPKELGKLKHTLRKMSLNNNGLTGFIPAELGNMTRLSKLEMYSNYLSGTAPAMLIPNNTRMFTVELDGNSLTGSIPMSYVNLPNLLELTLYNNHFSDSIPQFIRDCYLLQSLMLQNNEFIGTIPNIISNTSSQLNNVFLSNNLITGSIPTSVTQFLNNHLQYFAINNNFISGSIPHDIDNLQVLFEFNVENNLLTGTVPITIGNMTLLQYLDISSNKLHGTLPKSVSKLAYLVLFFVHDNNFHGNMNGLFNSTHQTGITSIDVSDNQFTGQIPTAPFLIAGFQTFAAVSNCITGSIPLEICGAINLTSLALDGLSSATSCQTRFNHISGRKATYTLTNSLIGGVPTCLFQMPHLVTLHLSGNGIAGPLSNELIMGPAFSDLSLDYNRLTGKIPPVLQDRPWINLGLSSNKFAGMISDNIPPPSNSSIVFKVNRLSGDIPSSLLHGTNVSILSGNMFSCPVFGDRGLPQGDPEVDTYACGANSFEVAIYTWLCVFTVVLVAATLTNNNLLPNHKVFLFITNTVKIVRIWMLKYSVTGRNNPSNNNKQNIVAFCQRHRTRMLYLGLYLFCIAMPVYYALTTHYKTHEQEYAYNASAIYLSGVVPALVLFFLTNFVVCLLCYHLTNETRLRKAPGNNMEVKCSKSLDRKTAAKLVAGFLSNAVIVIFVNISYVVVTLKYGVRVVFAAQIFLALFKISWNRVVFRSLTTWWKQLSGSSDVLLVVHVLLFNTILCPILATLVVSPDCFRDLFVAAAPVIATYDYQTCDVLHTPGTYSVCTAYTTVTATTSFTPPFTYSYQCSGALVTNYASVYVFMFMLNTIGPYVPVVLALLVRDYRGENKYVKFWITNLFSRMLIPSHVLLQLTNVTYVFNKDLFILRIISCLAVVLTFGVIFPPIAIVGVVHIFCFTFGTQTLIGRFMSIVEANPELTKFGAMMEVDCGDVSNVFWASFYPLLLLTPLFYSFFIFDTYGDVVGWKYALVLVIPTLFMAYFVRIMLGIAHFLTVKWCVFWSPPLPLDTTSTEPENDHQFGTENGLDDVEMSDRAVRKQSVEIDTHNKITESAAVKNPIAVSFDNKN